MSDPVSFMKCLPWTIREEVDWHDPFVWSDTTRNFSNDRHDPGGKTMCGIIQREYDIFRKGRDLQVQDVRLIKEWEGHWIYYNWYWLPHCGFLPPGLNLSVFDSNVNMGTHESTKLLQRTIGLPPDGVWGRETAAAVMKLTPAAAAVEAFAIHRLAAYEEMKGFQFFGKDWTERTHRIKDASLERIRDSGGEAGPQAPGEGNPVAGGPT